MRNLITFRHCLSGLFPSKNQFRSSSWLAVFLLALSLTGGWSRAQAETAETAPPRLKNLLVQLDAAANKHDVNAVMQFYSQNFINSDNLTHSSMQKTLTQLWQRYPQMKYQTQLQSWKPEGNAILAQTVTNITGTQADNRNMVLNSNIKSQQRFQGGKIIRQDILSERSQLSAGAKPPTVQVNLPQQVKTGQHYEFDAIDQQPLGDDYLLGAAIEEPVQADKYVKLTPVQLELLTAGGLFKQGQAPAKAQSLWVSAVLIRGGGMTMVTQRLRVVDGKVTADSIPPKNSF